MRIVACCTLAISLAVSFAQAEELRNLAITASADHAAKPPPASIADLVLLLESYKPDRTRVDALRSALEKPVPATEDPMDLARYWHSLARAAENLGDQHRTFEALTKAEAYAEKSGGSSAKDEIGSLKRIRQDLTAVTTTLVGIGKGIDAHEKYLRDFASIDPGASISIRINLARLYLQIGDLERARKTIDDAANVADRLRSMPYAKTYGSTWLTSVEFGRTELNMKQGRYDDAERSALAAERFSQQMILDSATNRASGGYGQAVERAKRTSHYATRMVASVYLAQGKLDEAELTLREVLKHALVDLGRTDSVVASILGALSAVYSERGRHAEAIVIAEWAQRIQDEIGYVASSPARIALKKLLAGLYAGGDRKADAARLFDELREASASEVKQGRKELEVETISMIGLYSSLARNELALAVSDRLLAAALAGYGPDGIETGEVHGIRAVALKHGGRLDGARQDFAQAIRIMVDGPVTNSKRGNRALVSKRRSIVLSEYVDLLVGSGSARSAPDVTEAFRIADVARWQSVQKAVSGSALRAAAGTPELGVQIKILQDADDELQAVYKNLIAQRSAPPDKILPVVITAMEKRIDELKKSQTRQLAEIRSKFPQYDALVNPSPATLSATQKVLRNGEALLSIFVTPFGSYVWAFGATGEIRFHFSSRAKAWVADHVAKLRAATDLTLGISPDQMKYDLEAAHALYRELLAPVSSAWEASDTLLVVVNDSLGQIPFGLLATAPPTPGPIPAETLPLARYRNVPWLARKLAIVNVPSVSALVSLRAVGSSKAQRAPFIGYGDPDFGSHTAKLAGIARGTRNLKIASARKWDESLDNLDKLDTNALAARSVEEQPMLTPLPDTRDEIIAIATALKADPASDTYFGARASVGAVISEDLRRRRIIAFATHGLVPGDLPGLDQPALALSPGPGKPINAGLLKLEDILKLSLDADLVVLSACNTAAADGDGSEAISGLGRGFFYAGSRSILATHWPVETVSAKQLVTHLFAQYTQDPTLTRAKALQKAMLEVLDREVASDAQGKPAFAYAHPAFWAPYALYGDPAR